MSRSVPHCAKFNDDILNAIAPWLDERDMVLDPFAGVGGITKLHATLPFLDIYCIELEHEWASQIDTSGGRVTVIEGDCLGTMATMVGNVRFDAIVTSPCLTPNQRVLRRDLRWVPCGDVKVGDELIAFDEHSPFVKANGHAARRKWRIATVTQSYGAKKCCVRVHLENGEYVDCTEDHPWLTDKYGYGRNAAATWTRADELLTAPWVMKQLEPWRDGTSYEAGWIAGMFDGEGSLSFGAHGSPKLMICQNHGPVANRVMRTLARLGYNFDAIARDDKMVNIYVTGGFPEILRVLGETRPTRLIKKLDKLDIASRTIQPRKIKVVHVEPIGFRDIQGIETSTGTYIGEGYLHHNTYGNRMADSHTPSPSDTSKRNTYTHTLGRKLSRNNSGAMQWGQQYRVFHKKAWRIATELVRDDGLFILNIKDHVRGGEVMRVSDWHTQTLLSLGWDLEGVMKIPTPGLREGANGEVRVDYEFIKVFKKEGE